jgi:micrococcal nuclease
VTVVDVVDGDTLDVRYANGSTDTVRLLGVDTPEVYSENDPAEYEGIPTTEAGRDCLRAAGEDATAFVERRLAGATVELVLDQSADRRDRYDRLLAYVVHENWTLNYRLVARGHARVYDSTFRYEDAFYAAEARAQSERRGLWQCRSPDGDTSPARSDTSDSPLSIARIHADAAGNDNENLNDEYVVFRNDGAEPLAVGGWTVTDEAGHAYTFPDGATVAPDGTVTLYTGVGTDGDGDYYWNREQAVWNNDGDTVVVTNATGADVARSSY